MTSSTTIATVGATIGYVFFTTHVCRASSAFSRTAIYFHVINKIRFSHFLLLFEIMSAKVIISVDFLKFFNRNKYLFFFHFLACLIYMLHKHIGKNRVPITKRLNKRYFYPLLSLFLFYTIKYNLLHCINSLTDVLRNCF